MLLKTKNKVIQPDWKFSWKLLPNSILSLEIFPGISKFGSNFLPLPTAMSYKKHPLVILHATFGIAYLTLSLYSGENSNGTFWIREFLVKQKIKNFQQKLNMKKDSGHSQTKWNHDVFNAVHEDDISISLFQWNSNYLVIIF